MDELTCSGVYGNFRPHWLLQNGKTSSPHALHIIRNFYFGACRSCQLRWKRRSFLMRPLVDHLLVFFVKKQESTWKSRSTCYNFAISTASPARDCAGKSLSRDHEHPHRTSQKQIGNCVLYTLAVTFFRQRFFPAKTTTMGINWIMGKLHV